MDARANLKRGAQEYLLVFLAVLVFGLLIHAGIQVRGLYADDLYLYSCYGEYPLSYYLFPTGGQRFRFVFNLLAYPVMWLMNTHVSWIVTMNVVMNSLMALMVYHMAKRIGGYKWMAAACAFAYMLSRFSYYQITLMYGMLETFSQAGALLVLYQLYLYFNEPDGGRHYEAASIICFFNSFIHERYMVLTVLLILAVFATRLLGRKERAPYRLLLWPAAVLILIQVIRYWAIGSLSPAGTGGTTVAETFAVKQVVKYALSQICYLFGVNAGYSYLCGLEWKDVTAGFRFLIYLADGALILIVVQFLGRLIGAVRQKEREDWYRYLGNALLFTGFIAMCIAASSVTIRVELRWIYVSYTACLLFLAYMKGELKRADNRETQRDGRKRRRRLVSAGCLAAVYFLCLIPTELHYRRYWDRLYYWQEQQRFNSLAEMTWETYGEELFEKTVVIVEDPESESNFHLSQFTADYFFMPYTKDHSSKTPRVEFADDLEMAGELVKAMDGESIVLLEDPDHDRFLDATFLFQK